MISRPNTLSPSPTACGAVGEAISGISRAGIQRGTTRLCHDFVDAPDMIGVLVGEDHVSDRFPIQPGLAEGDLDRGCAPSHPGVDQAASPIEDVGRDELEVHAGRKSGRRQWRRGRWWWSKPVWLWSREQSLSCLARHWWSESFPAWWWWRRHHRPSRPRCRRRRPRDRLSPSRRSPCDD